MSTTKRGSTNTAKKAKASRTDDPFQTQADVDWVNEGIKLRRAGVPLRDLNSEILKRRPDLRPKK